MKLRSLTVNQFKKFTSPVRLSGLADGLNLVIGPNEMGKSTLLEALRAVLFERHRSRAQPIMALRNDRTQAAPVVEAEFEVEGEWYRLRKRFLKSPFARLECGDGRVLEGDAAEEELRRLLGFQEAGTRGATEDTLGMWGVLWVRQGQSFGAPSLPDSARASLSEGLEAEVGSVLGGRRGRELPQVVEDRLEELVTRAQRRPRGAYKEAIDGVAALEEELAGLQAQRAEMSETLERLSSAQDELARLVAGEAAGEDEASLRAARAELQRQEQLEARIVAARSQLELRQRDLEAAERRLSERAALRERIADQERELAREEAELEALLPEEVSQRDGLAAAQEQVRRAEAGWSAAEASSRRARTLVNAVASGAELERLRAAREAASAAAAALGEARRQAAAILVDDAALARIREAERRSTRAAAQLEAQATRVRFALSPQSSGQGQLLDDGLLVDGEPLSEAVRAGGAAAGGRSVGDRSAAGGADYGGAGDCGSGSVGGGAGVGRDGAGGGVVGRGSGVAGGGGDAVRASGGVGAGGVAGGAGAGAGGAVGRSGGVGGADRVAGGAAAGLPARIGVGGGDGAAGAGGR